VPFRSVLEAYVARHPGARAAVLCDDEGERIDLAVGAMAAFDVDVLGAVLAGPAAQCGGRLRIRLDDTVLWMSPVADGCYVVVACAPGLDAACGAELASVAAALRAAM
jgi:hypothetical protein